MKFIIETGISQDSFNGYMIRNFTIQNSILTARLILKKLSVHDTDFILSIVNSKGWLENIGDRNIHSKKEATEYINKILRTENFTYWVVRTRDTNTSIGIISLIKRAYLENFDIGFAFLPEYHNYGYAYEAAKSVLMMVSRSPEFKIMLATTLPSNISSIKLLTKLGFRYEKENETENNKMHIYTNAPLQ
ncbi:MAG TPA: GNAT family N-acetyltransferase [Puia sp.]|nr:GNAT family N-acetyltransferase [Puia sp.]